MSLSKKKLDMWRIRCPACRTRPLDYPFAHQYCQHVVCGKCSYKQKSELYCIACRAQAAEYSTPLAILATKNGHCQQIYDIAQPIYGDIMNGARQDLATVAPQSYAQATVQSSTLVSSVGVQPIISQLPKQPRSWCSCLMCCCIWEAIGSILTYVIKFIAFLAVFAWMIWAINWVFTGKTDLSNLPFFRNLPYADATQNQATTPAMPINFNGFAPSPTPTASPPGPKYNVQMGLVQDPTKRRDL